MFYICWRQSFDIFDIFFIFDLSDIWSRCRRLIPTGRPVFNQVSLGPDFHGGMMMTMTNGQWSSTIDDYANDDIKDQDAFKDTIKGPGSCWVL